MQKAFYTLFVLVLLCQVLTVRAQITCTPNAAMTGQSVTVSILGNGANFTGTTSTYLHSQSAGNIFPTQWSLVSSNEVLANYLIPVTAALGSYDVIVASIGLTTLPNGFSILPGGYSGNYGQVTGRVYDDANGNCVQNIGEPALPNRILEFLPGPYYASTDLQGNYAVVLPLGSYTAAHYSGLNYSNVCPSSGVLNVTLSSPGQVVAGQNFGAGVVPFADGGVLMCGQLLRPGFTSSQHMNIHNFGTTAITSMTVKCLKPSYTTFVGSTIPPSNIVGDTLFWNLANIGVGQNQPIHFDLQTPASTPLGTVYSIPIWLTATTPNDQNAGNNFYQCFRTITGSYDPNEKLVFLPNGQNADGDILPTDSMLHYEVHFQNTGTDTAFNVYIRDTLDLAGLDISTFQMLGASHNYQMHFTGNSGELEVYFPNIMLPDSGANMGGSNGYFAYQIQRRSNLPVTTVIPNSAAIYFDFNAPVITNTTHTRICEGLSATITSSANLLSYSFQSQTTGANTYFWTFGDGDNATTANAVHVYANPGTYQVCLTVTNSCGTSYTTCDSITAISVGTPDPAAGLQVQIQPHPVQQQAQILVTGPQQGSYELTLYNLAGQAVAQHLGEINTPLLLDRKHLPSGLYLARIAQQGTPLRVVKVLLE